MSISKFAFLFLLLTAAARACDLCGCYTPTLEIVSAKSYGFYAGVAEQFTHFGTERLDGEKQSNPAGEKIDSSITQIVVGGSFFDNRAGLQLSVPIIYRSYRRLLGFDTENGHLSGIGDIALTANVIAWKKDALFHDDLAPSDGKSAPVMRRGDPDFTARVSLTAGVKLPTGDTSKLKENFKPEIEDAPDSGIGPHDLTLGTGSVDGIFGLQTELRYKAAFFQADVQYTVRGYGDYHYRFANDLSWSGGPGVYLYRRGARSLALQAVLSGETKGYDTFGGERDPDSSVTELFAGPRVIANFGHVNGEVGVDIPVITNATSYQLTADYRIRAGFSIHF